MMPAWSKRIAERYRCRPSAELADWFDSGAWKASGHGEFRQSISPEALVSETPEAIWPGMMGSNCLPILHNTAGDWLCVQIDQDNTASQIVHWYHGGGDWIPWGKNLAEAIAFDAVAIRFPSHAIRYAVPAESPRPEHLLGAAIRDPYRRWASDHLAKSIIESIDSDSRYDEIAAELLVNRVAEVAIRCELTISTLMERPGDWQAAAAHAEPVTRTAPELGWAWETIGIAAEISGKTNDAKHAYMLAAGCSAFTDQSVRLATCLSTGHAAKSAIVRLRDLDGELVESSEYLRLLCIEDENERLQKVGEYWIRQGEQFSRQADHAAAYTAFVAAGWDLGMTRMETTASILDHLVESATASHQTARAESARTHRACLKVRCGI